MTSQIDPTVPIFGSPTTASVRENFLIAKNEITALQGLVNPLPGRAPSIPVGGSGFVTLPAASDCSVFISNLTGSTITLTIGNGILDQRILFKDTAGNAGTYNIHINASSIDGSPSYTLLSNYASLQLVWMGSAWGTF